MIVLHVLAGINTHIAFDLGIATRHVAADGPVEPLRHDFIVINDVLIAQVKTILAEIDGISPVLAALYDVMQTCEIAIIDQTVIAMREGAWRFATMLEHEPAVFESPTIALRDLGVSAVGAAMLNPPPATAAIVAAIARRESTDVAAIIRALDDIASAPLIA